MQTRVWAPAAKSLEIETGGFRCPMEATGGGWWSGTVAEEADYLFSVDGGPLTPDPRSAWQPQGVHGCSRMVDHAAYAWTDGHWRRPALGAGVIYELHVGTFTPEGTFLGAIAKLDHLVSLGITHVELMPVNEFSGVRGWGYDGVYLYAPHHHYGTPSDLKNLVNACHARGLAVLLDVVYNHLGPIGNYLNRFGPYYTSRYVTPWGQAMNLDAAGSVEVRRFLCDNALMWLRDYHFDGLRLDAIHELIDISAVPILEQMSAEVAELGDGYLLIGESDLNHPVVVTPRENGGWGLTAQWSDDFHHSLHAVLTGERNGYYTDFGSLADLAKAFRQAFVYDGKFSVYRQREHGRAAGDLSGDHFLAYAQNHDQVGNRGTGTRTSHILTMGRLKMAAALAMVSPYVPMLFQGEEWAASTPFQYFTAHEDPDVARNVREGRVREFVGFGWKPEDVPDPQSAATFEASRLNWNEVTEPRHAEMLSWYCELIALRRATPELLDGRRDLVEVSFDEEARWFRVERGPVTVMCYLAEDRVEVQTTDRNRSTIRRMTSSPGESQSAWLKISTSMGPE